MVNIEDWDDLDQDQIVLSRKRSNLLQILGSNLPKLLRIGQIAFKIVVN